MLLSEDLEMATLLAYILRPIWKTALSWTRVVVFHPCMEQSNFPIEVPGEIRFPQGIPCKTNKSGPWPGGSLVGASSRTPEGRRFDSQSEHIPQLRVQSLVRVCTGGE